jgi:hypothetical protein
LFGMQAQLSMTLATRSFLKRTSEPVSGSDTRR